MKRELFVKLPSDIAQQNSAPKKLVNVCAWCSKDTYPKLKNDEEYSHGLCEEHYRFLRLKINQGK